VADAPGTATFPGRTNETEETNADGAGDESAECRSRTTRRDYGGKVFVRERSAAAARVER